MKSTSTIQSKQCGRTRSSVLFNIAAIFSAVLLINSGEVNADSSIPGWHETPTESHPYFANDKKIEGEIRLSESLVDRGYAKRDFKFTGSDVIYVIARKNKNPNTPPVAVVRIADLNKKKFPISFTIGPQDLMLKENSFVGPFHLKAKLSRHGDASTAAGDLIGYSSSAEIKMGSSDIAIDLSEVAGSDGLLSAKGAHPRAKQGTTLAAKSMPAGSGSEAPIGKAPKEKTSEKVAEAPTGSSIVGHVNVSAKMKKKLAKMKFKFKSTDVLFIVAKDAASKGMQPSAVVRVVGLEGKQFPIAFKITANNMMMGVPAGFKGPFLIKAKISRQGGVMTQAGDLYSAYSSSKKVAVGSKNVAVILTAVK